MLQSSSKRPFAHCHDTIRKPFLGNYISCFGQNTIQNVKKRKYLPFPNVFMLVVLVLIHLYRPNVTQVDLGARSGCHSNVRQRSRWCFFCFVLFCYFSLICLYLLAILLVLVVSLVLVVLLISVVSFRPFCLVVSGLSTCQFVLPVILYLNWGIWNLTCEAKGPNQLSTWHRAKDCTMVAVLIFNSAS